MATLSFRTPARKETQVKTIKLFSRYGKKVVCLKLIIYYDSIKHKLIYKIY